MRERKNLAPGIDPLSYVFDLNQTIGQIPRANVSKSGLEEFSLKNGGDIRDNNYDSRMQRLLAEERKKISSIVWLQT